jgi:acyl carrier protein
MPPSGDWDALIADRASAPELVERIAAVRELEALGAEVLAVSADVSSEAEMSEVLAHAERRFGEIDGLVHCAGVTTVGRVLLDTGLSEFEQNFRSKVFGLIVLDRLLARRRLDFGIVVSSLSAVLGGLGHMAYAAANACADALVLERNQNGLGIWTTVDFDSWKFEAGRVDKVQAMLNKLDFSMDEAEGTKAIELLLSMQSPEHVIVSTGSLGARAALWIERHAVLQSADAAGSGQHQRPDVETPFEEPSGAIEQRLATIWQDALGLDRVGRNDDFFEIGGHSLLAVQILSKTRDAFGIDFPLDRAVEVARLSSAAAVIAELLEGGPAPVEALESEARLVDAA